MKQLKVYSVRREMHLTCGPLSCKLSLKNCLQHGNVGLEGDYKIQISEDRSPTIKDAAF